MSHVKIYFTRRLWRSNSPFNSYLTSLISRLFLEGFLFCRLSRIVYLPSDFCRQEALAIGRRPCHERSRTVSVNLVFRRKEIRVTSGNRFRTITLTTFRGRGCIIHASGLRGIYVRIVSTAVATCAIVDLQSRLLEAFLRVCCL